MISEYRVIASLSSSGTFGNILASPDKISNHYDAIIIGSGISGLCTAALLSMNNKKVLVLEKHFKVGGYTHTFKRQDYEWDVGIHYIGGVHLKKTFTRRLFDKITNFSL